MYSLEDLKGSKGVALYGRGRSKDIDATASHPLGLR